jgi:ribosomal protein S8
MNVNATVDFVNKLNFALKKREKFFFCKKSKLNISFLNLLLLNGLIISFYHCKNKFLCNELCVFIKYWQKLPLIKNVFFSKNFNFINAIQKKADVVSNLFYIVACSAGGLTILSSFDYNKKCWYNKVGGKILFKILL